MSKKTAYSTNIPDPLREINGTKNFYSFFLFFSLDFYRFWVSLTGFSEKWESFHCMCVFHVCNNFQPLLIPICTRDHKLQSVSIITDNARKCVSFVFSHLVELLELLWWCHPVSIWFHTSPACVAKLYLDDMLFLGRSLVGDI